MVVVSKRGEESREVGGAERARLFVLQSGIMGEDRECGRRQ